MIRKGSRIQELTKKVGQIPRKGVVLDLHGDTVEVKWDDGHVSILSDGVIVPEAEAKSASN